MQQYRFTAEQHKLFGCIASKPSARSSGYDNDVSLHKALELPVGGETYYPRKECFVRHHRYGTVALFGFGKTSV